MRTLLYTLLLLALTAGGCSKWNVADKEIKPDGTTNPPVNTTSGAVTLNFPKPTVLGHTTATISFKGKAPGYYGVWRGSDA
jgi:hypothetical protein